jgi:hypothetical protein
VATPAEKARMVENLRLTFDMFETGVDMMRQSLRRRFPAEADPAIEARVVAWLRERPGAEHGDAEGEAGAWPRPHR